MMDDCNSLKIRSDLYLHKSSVVTTPMSELEQTASQLSTHDNNRNIIEENSKEPECNLNKDSTLPDPSPQDWNPEEPCFVCTGNKLEDSGVNLPFIFIKHCKQNTHI